VITRFIASSAVGSDRSAIRRRAAPECPALVVTLNDAVIGTFNGGQHPGA
jgi:hypothetical protein